MQKEKRITRKISFFIIRTAFRIGILLATKIVPIQKPDNFLLSIPD
jgi:hypothetical protein